MCQNIDSNVEEITMFTAPFLFTMDARKKLNKSFWQQSHKTPDNILKQTILHQGKK